MTEISIWWLLFCLGFLAAVAVFAILKWSFSNEH